MIAPTLKLFRCTRKERLAFGISVSLSLLFLTFPILYPLIINTDSTINYENFEFNISKFISTPLAYNEDSNWREKESKVAVKLFKFNPNNATKEDFVTLGLSEKLASTIINYRNKGGKFFKKEDLKKIYGLRNEDYQRLESYIMFEEQNHSFSDKKNSSQLADNQKNDKSNFELFEFNPNNATKEDFQKLGLSEKLANTIINYRTKGGKFFKPEDFRKIYGLSESDFKRLLPFILIEQETFIETEKEKIPKVEKPHTDRANRTNLQIDINKASAEDWQKLKGIGPAYSKRIVKFRDALGGFYKIEQISETFGLPDSTFQSIKSQLKFSPVTPKLKINEADYKTLIKHPYLNKSQTKAILNYRKQHQKFADEAAFKAFFGNYGIEKFERLKAYLVY